MTIDNRETRDRVRQLVRQILESVPTEDDSPQSQPAVDRQPERFVVNSLREKAGQLFARDESSKSLLTEDDLRGLDPGSRIRVARNVKLTPLAKDLVDSMQFELIPKESRMPETSVTSVSIGCDHGGFSLKEELKAFLPTFGVKITDHGTNSTDAVDYPDYAHAVAIAVANRQSDVGIIIDGAGIGSAMTANKVPGIRAAACYSTALAKNSREHNGANVLTLGSGQNSFEEVKEIVTSFLLAEISEDRHKKRVEKINEVARKYQL